MFARLTRCAVAFVAMFSPVSAYAEDAEQTACDRLVVVFMELAERSGEPVTEEEARAEVMADNPSDDECAAMLAMFPPME